MVQSPAELGRLKLEVEFVLKLVLLEEEELELELEEEVVVERKSASCCNAVRTVTKISSSIV